MTNNKQQTAVGWFLNQLIKDGYIKRIPVLQLQQAKEMEKEQIIVAASDHCYPTCELATIDAEQYYNETYGEGEQ
jgi:hypothetical protein